MSYLGNTGLTRLIELINDKFAPTASPSLSGIPTAPTATASTNTAQIATTAFVKNVVDNATVNSIPDSEIEGYWE